jgi:hypothetical protein
MFWMMVGGAALFLLIVVGVVVAMRSGDEPAPPIAAEAPPMADAGLIPAKSDVVLLEEAEPVVRSFLEARSVEEMLPFVRNPEQAEPRMRPNAGRFWTRACGRRRM